jgi:hypothetical protein
MVNQPKFWADRFSGTYDLWAFPIDFRMSKTKVLGAGKPKFWSGDFAGAVLVRGTEARQR